MSFELNALFGSVANAIEQMFSLNLGNSTESPVVESPVAKITVQDLCTKMHDQGFVYAAFHDPTKPLEATFRNPTNVWVKPEEGMIFSALRTYDEDDCGIAVWVPEWYLFTEDEFEIEFEENAKYDLVFAKIDLSNVLDSKERQHLIDYEVKKSVGQYITEYKWGEISKSFHGVSGSGVPEHNRYLCWDVKTVVLWNKNAVVGDVVIFKNAGSYEYSRQSLDSRGAPSILLE
jgi:hypothetical protein